MVCELVDTKRSISAAFAKNVRHSGKPSGPDKYCDRHGIIPRVQPTGSKQWIWRGTVQGKRVDLGLGSWPYVSLARPDKRHSSTGSCPGLEATRERCALVGAFRHSRRQSKQSSAFMSRGGRTAARPQSVSAQPFETTPCLGSGASKFPSSFRQTSCPSCFRSGPPKPRLPSGYASALEP